ncbi:MAG: alpha/beta hydrolase, partial [Planctomycetota bacterium]
MEHFAVPATVRGTVLLDLPPVGQPQWLLIGFHGYGENAAIMLPRLRLPVDLRMASVAVQALHPFYRSADKVGHSWMTSEERTRHIEDNLGYCERVLDELRARMHWERVAWCGFSQGAPMAVRAAQRYGGHALILNGGELPPGEAIDQLPPILLGRGDSDPIYTAADCERDRLRLTDAGRTVHVVSVAGG